MGFFNPAELRFLNLSIFRPPMADFHLVCVGYSTDSLSAYGGQIANV